MKQLLLDRVAANPLWFAEMSKSQFEPIGFKGGEQHLDDAVD
jgi:hypothetical protein